MLGHLHPQEQGQHERPPVDLHHPCKEGGREGGRGGGEKDVIGWRVRLVFLADFLFDLHNLCEEGERGCWS